MKNKLIGSRAFYRRTLAVMLPILVQNIITQFVSLLDNLMVGQVGTEPMSGVAIVNELIFVFNICVFGCVEGADIFTAQFYGKGDLDGVRSSFRFKLMFLACNLALFFTVYSVFGEQLISLFIHEGSGEVSGDLTLKYAMDYLKIARLQMLPFCLVQLYSGTLKCGGQTVIPMRSGVIAVAINASLNYVLIFGKLGLPALGVEGAAIATVIARFVEFFIVSVWAHTHKKEAGFTEGLFTTLKVPAELSKRMLKMGLPLFANEVLWSVGNAIQNQSYSTRGIDVVPAVNITNVIAELFNCTMFAMGTTIAILVGHRLGAGELKEAVEDDTKLIALTVAICLVLGIMMFFLAPVVPMAYNTTDGVRSLASSLLTVCAVMLPVNALVNSCYFTLRSGGKTLYTMIFDSFFMWGVMVPVALVLSRLTGMPIIPLYAVVQSLSIIKGVVGFILVRKKVWVNNLVA